jgi:hypothetical protein
MARLRKRDAAERLLIQAVKLQFSDGDPFAIHLLIMSSLRICRDVRALNGSIVDEFQVIVRPEKTNEFFRLFYSIASFFKHADRDQDSLLDFPHDLPKHNERLTMLVAYTFQQAFNAPSKNFIVHAAVLYYRKLHPNIILPVSNEAKNYDQTLGLLDTTVLQNTIRDLVREGPSSLGPQDWINDWTW